MKRQIIYTISIVLLLWSVFMCGTEIRCRTGIYKKSEIYDGKIPANINSRPDLNYSPVESSFVKLEIILDSGRSISTFDYVLKTSENTQKFKCVAVSEDNNFDVENWQIGPFKEAKLVSLLFCLPSKEMENNNEFFLSFDLPVGYDAPDISISLPKVMLKNEQEKKLASIAKKEEKVATSNIKKIEENEKSTNTNVVQATETFSFTGKIDKINVNPKSFTFYVKKSDGSCPKICLYGVVPAQDTKVHSEIEKILNKKYKGAEVNVLPAGKPDKYNRIVAKIFQAEKYINKEMILDGLAFYAFQYAPNDSELENIIKK